MGALQGLITFLTIIIYFSYITGPHSNLSRRYPEDGARRFLRNCGNHLPCECFNYRIPEKYVNEYCSFPSVVGIAIGYGLDTRGAEVRVLVG
jgi:hypothetical protein